MLRRAGFFSWPRRAGRGLAEFCCFSETAPENFQKTTKLGQTRMALGPQEVAYRSAMVVVANARGDGGTLRRHIRQGDWFRVVTNQLHFARQAFINKGLKLEQLLVTEAGEKRAGSELQLS